jgi:hypothetical protein
MSPDDPARMSADERIDEVAAILAAGFLRLKRRTPCLPAPDPASCESAGSSKIPAESTCHLSETSPLCPSR